MSIHWSSQREDAARERRQAIAQKIIADRVSGRRRREVARADVPNLGVTAAEFDDIERAATTAVAVDLLAQHGFQVKGVPMSSVVVKPSITPPITPPAGEPT